MTTALLLIDFQNDYFPSYPGARYPLVGAEQAAERAAEVLAIFRQQQWPILHVRHEFPSEEAPFFLPGSEGAQIHPSLTPTAAEPVILKNQVNSFHQTDLLAQLREADVTDLLVVGAMSHMCIDAAVRAASDLGFNCTVLEDGCATRDLEHAGQTVPAQQVQTAYMSALGFAYASVENSADYLSKLN